MKFSRKFVSVMLGLTSIFCSGAMLGSYIPNIPMYAIIVACCVTLVLFGLWFYYGHKKEYDDENEETED